MSLKLTPKKNSSKKIPSQKFIKAVNNTLDKVDNEDFKIERKISNLEEEEDADIDQKELKFKSSKKDLTKREKEIIKLLNQYVKQASSKSGIHKLYKFIEDELDITLSDNNIEFIKDYLREFNKRDKYGLSCIDGSNLQLKDYQANVVKHMLTHRGLLVFHNMGSGKTLTAVVSTQCALQSDKKMDVVVVTPTSLQKNFHKELLAYGIEDKGGPKYHYFTFRSFYLKFKDQTDKQIEKYFNNKFLVIDEAHTLKYKPDPNETKLAYRKSKLERLKTVSPKESKVTKVFLQASRFAEKVLLLSGTPILNRPADIINLIAMIDGEKPIGLETFEDAIYGRIEFDQPEQGIKNTENFDKYFDCKISFYKTKDIINYPTVNEQPVVLRMTDEIYDEYLKVQFMNQNPNVFYTDLRQATNNLGGKKNPKVKWIKEKLLEESNHPLHNKTIIYSNYIPTYGKKGKDKILMDHIIDFMKKNDIKYTIITGESSKTQRDKSVQLYNNNKVQVMLISSAGGLGLDLKGTKNVILVEANWNRELTRQIIARGVRYLSHAHLPENERYVNVYHLILSKPKQIYDYDDMISVDRILYRFSIEKQQNVDKFIKELKKRSIEKKSC